MPNSNLNAGEVSQAKAWLSDIYVLADEMQPVRPADYQHGYNWIKTRDVTAAKHVCKVINSSLFESIEMTSSLLQSCLILKLLVRALQALKLKA